MAQTLETAKVELAMGCFFLSNSLNKAEEIKNHLMEAGAKVSFKK